MFASRSKTTKAIARPLAIPALALALAATTAGCGDGAEGPGGTWTHDEEGTIVFGEDGTGTITQSGDPVPFEWTLDSGEVSLDLDGDPANGAEAVATLTGNELTFRAGDFSGEDPVTFIRG